MKLYLNGVLQNKKEVTGKLDIYNSNLAIGMNENLKIFTPGVYDDFRLFDRALTEQEINDIAKN